MSSINKGLRRVGIVGLSTLVAASMMTLTAVPAQAAWAATGGDIGLVDTDTTSATNGTQGATLVYPGVNGQALGDIRLLIPNSFVNGDTIDLTIFDRTATTTPQSAGQINADAAHKLGFTSAPKVVSNATPVAASTNIGPLSNSPFNTEGTTANGNAPAPAPAPAGTQVAAVQPPVFTTSVLQSSRANGLATDIIRMTINGVQATVGSDPAVEWIVTVSGLKADLGAAVSPGELRVVPFAYNGTPTTTTSNPSPLFQGNLADVDGVAGTFDPRINLYTVPAYVAPVTFNIGAPNNIVADGTVQTIGDITIAETNNYSLQNATYTVTIAGATIGNTTAAPVTVTTTGLATGETVSSPAVVVGNTLQFTLAGASNTSKISIKLSGLLLFDSSEGAITYTLSGGSIPLFLADPAGTSPIIGSAPPNGVLADSAFGSVVVTPSNGTSAINQEDIDAPTLPAVNSFSSDTVRRIGGGDRYETAAKIALNNGENKYIVLASGENFPDALSSGYLANQVGGGSIVLTTRDRLPVVTATTMRELGTQTVFIVGGTGVVSSAVEAQLKATPQYYAGGEITMGQGKLNVVRLGGANRYATNKVVNQYAAALFEFANPVGRTSITFGQASKLTALVATGEKFPDALAAGPATSGTRNGGRISGNLPLILTQSAGLNADAKDQLNNLGIQQAVVVGGTGAVSAATEASVVGLGVAVHRIGGADRYSTATLIADFVTAPVAATATVKGGLGFDQVPTAGTERAYLATGVVFADALAGATLAGGSASPILLTNPTTLSAATRTWLSAHSAQYSSVVAFGLAGAVSNAALDAANAAIAGG